MPEDAVKNVKKAKERGKSQYDEFCERLTKGTKKVHDPIPKNKFLIFKESTKKKASKARKKLSDAKYDCRFFAKMYVACVERGGDLDTFFAHEHQAWPPNLAESNKMRPAINKADLVTKKLEKMEPSLTLQQLKSQKVEVKVIDGTQLSLMIDPHRYSHLNIVTLHDHVCRLLVPEIQRQLSDCTILHTIFDVYLKNTFKSSLREKRTDGQNGIRTKVLADTVIPKDWKGFFSLDENKQDFFVFAAPLIAALVTVPNGKTLYVTQGSQVLSVPLDVDKSQLSRRSRP